MIVRGDQVRRWECRLSFQEGNFELADRWSRDYVLHVVELCAGTAQDEPQSEPILRIGARLLKDYLSESDAVLSNLRSKI